MVKTKKYWVEYYVDYFFNEGSDETKMRIDPVDMADHISAVYNQLIGEARELRNNLNGRDRLSSLARHYASLSIEKSGSRYITTLTKFPALGEMGVITVKFCETGDVAHKRRVGSEVPILGYLQRDSENQMPTYHWESNKLVWEFQPVGTTCDVWLIPDFALLDDEDEVLLPSGRDENFTHRLVQLVSAKMGTPTDLTNNTSPNA